MERLMRRLNGSLSRSVRRSVQDIFQQSPLDLRFALQKTLDPRVTFTRASSGTYVGSDGLLKTATNDVPRFDHNPTTGESLGLLVEEQRTNLLLRSEEFDNASWSKANTTVTANQATAPDGSANADLIAGNAGTAAKYIYGLYSASTSGAFTFSVFAKAGTESFIVVRITDQGGVNEVRQRFDLSSGTLNGSVAVGGTATAGSSSISAVANGWYRCAVTATFAAFTQLQGNVWLNNYASTALTTNFYLWGAQLEAGAFPTSYIPTTTATATRSADVASITGTNFSSWYRQDEGTVFADADRNTAIAAATTVVSINDNTTNNRLLNLRQDSSSQLTVVSQTGGVLDGSPQVSLINTSARNKVAAAQALNNLAASANGGAAVADTSVAVPTVNQMQIGNVTNVSLYNGTIRRLTYWPQRLSNTTLQQITA